MTGLATIRVGFACGAFLLGAGGALAQQPPQPQPQAAQPSGKVGPAFTQNRGQPINITAQSLEVRDKDKIATFTGKVRAVQGDTILETAKLIVFYEGDATGSGNSGAGNAPSRPAQSGQMPASSQIKRLEAKGGVVLTQKDQTAVGEEGVYDMKTDTVTLTGNVTATQGKNVISGHKMVVDMKTGLTRVDPLPGQTVSTSFTPNDQPKPAEKPKPAAPAAQPQKPAANGRGSANTGNRSGQAAPRRDASQPIPLRQ